MHNFIIVEKYRCLFHLYYKQYVLTTWESKVLVNIVRENIYDIYITWPFTNVFQCMYWMYSTKPGGRLNIKMLSYQYRDPHIEDKTVSRPSYL